MRKGLTEIVLVLDRSGSMESIKRDAQGGMRAFVDEQRKAPGEGRLTFYRFDDTIERVFEDRDIRWIEDYELKLDPRGSTALLDAIGRAINEVGARLANRREEDRPEHVVFVTVTDGQENASKEFVATKDDVPTYRHDQKPWLVGAPDPRPAIFDMIKKQESVYSWKFIFIGSTQESVLMASKLGYNPALTLSNRATGQSYGATYAALSSNVGALRKGMGAQSLNFSSVQRSAVLEDDDDKTNGKINTPPVSSSGGPIV